MLATVEGESNNLLKRSRTGKVLKFPLRKWEEAHLVLSFLCNDYVITVITCVIQSSQSISARCFIDTDVNFLCFIHSAEALSDSFTERLA